MKSLIIIGGGILGASTAYEAAKAGAEVILIDRADSGQATGAAAGIVCPWISQRRNKAWYHLAKSGAKYYPALIKELEELGETDTGYKQVGIVSIHEDSKLDKMEAKARERKEDAPEMGEVERLTAEQTQALFPHAGNEYGSLYVSGAARVDGRAVRDALVSAARKLGAEIIAGDAKLIIENDKVIGVKTEQQEIYADSIVSAGGAWAPELFGALGLEMDVVPQKAQILQLQLEETATGDWPVAMVPFGQYIVPFANGRIIAGATHENNAGFDTKLTAGGIHHVLDKVLDVVPGLAAAELTGASTGFRPSTLSALPFIGQVPEHGNLFAANALGSSGLTAGPFLGAQLAKIAMGISPDIELGDYAIDQVFRKI
ncbi:NAD(P)/FAD-dependent oxidoreductase [Planococcus halotolerans]|uniref:FAD-dependent oxidoreductase n=1 Tax=Planococcus halotolerans TaxID=2233542 RepID=A0A365KRN6_9BACL|nr:FAD-dependent oxidoreductase [Planococcus halotolerans]QHJ72304.1 FAD-dependent oxidoreductase [Planococcus halotolerans]RAZ75790.1 FAD-dependent oxidoreductase [Planococcus halotolerans]